MADEPSFQVYPNASVKRQIREILVQLQSQGLADSFTKTLERIATHLGSNPQSFGDPLFRLKLPGAITYHRLIEGVSLHYAVYPADRVVFVYAMKYVG